MWNLWRLGMSACLLAAVALAAEGTIHAAEKKGTAHAAEKREAAVSKAVSQFYAALNRLFTGEVEPMADVWSHADDVTYMGPTGGMQVGWEEVLAIWKTQASLRLGGKVEPKKIHVHAGREIAVVSGLEVGENVVDGKAQKVSIRATNVFRKEDGKWKMIGHHTDLLPYLER